ncbi:phage portal protein [Cytobacillus sp. IB215665]|uniref:phage portal protein n=1 Tax=Cytobacillus sp. IB215665 TaxID=3097357 RepID=UPI002A168FE6|nr:phage portal protein [Cytobacillus sp. IB215665]MDX8367850.1 phage portal protein [Cytobacillus sp. IB215665]
MNIDNKLLEKLRNELRKQRSGLQRYKDYYDGKHSILNTYTEQEDQANMKLVFNFPKKFVTNMAGYSLGTPLTYISRTGKDQAVHDIELNFSHWEKAHNQKLSKEADIYGEAYEINYINADGEFASVVATPMTMYILTDGSEERNVTAAIHTFKKPFDDAEYLDVYTEDKIIHYKDDNLTLIGTDTHIFGRVPINIFRANDESECIYNDIITLVDAYNVINSDLTNEISDHRNAMIKVLGAKLDDEEEIKKLKKYGILNVPTGADVDWLIKNINDTFVQNTLTNIEKKIYDLMDQVNFNEQWASNTSNVALKNKLLALSHRCSLKESLFEKAIMQRLKNFFTYLGVKQAKKVDYRDIKVKFTRNLPFDIVSTADAVSKLENIVSQETLLSLLPFVENPALEIEKFNKERENNRISLDGAFNAE